MPYQLIRYYQADDKPSERIGVVSTLEEAQEHCSDPETSSKTATGEDAVARTAQYGPWFDGYEEV